MVEITYQMVLSTLQTVGILVGIFYYLTILRNAQKARQRELIHKKTPEPKPRLHKSILGASYMDRLGDR